MEASDQTLDVEALAELTVLDTAGNVVRLGELWKKEPVALFFVRHYG